MGTRRLEPITFFCTGGKDGWCEESLTLKDMPNLSAAEFEAENTHKWQMKHRHSLFFCYCPKHTDPSTKGG